MYSLSHHVQSLCDEWLTDFLQVEKKHKESFKDFFSWAVYEWSNLLRHQYFQFIAFI